MGVLPGPLGHCSLFAFILTTGNLFYWDVSSFQWSSPMATPGKGPFDQPPCRKNHVLQENRVSGYHWEMERRSHLWSPFSQVRHDWQEFACLLQLAFLFFLCVCVSKYGAPTNWRFSFGYPFNPRAKRNQPSYLLCKWLLAWLGVHAKSPESSSMAMMDKASMYSCAMLRLSISRA